MVKSPKLYFTDVGLASYLLGIETVEQMGRDPLRGNLVENLVVLELIKFRLNRGLDPQLYYFRDSHGHEVDLIFQSANQLIPIEIKTAKTFHTGFLKNLHFFQKLAQERCPHGFILYAGNRLLAQLKVSAKMALLLPLRDPNFSPTLQSMSKNLDHE